MPEDYFGGRGLDFTLPVVWHTQLAVRTTSTMPLYRLLEDHAPLLRWQRRRLVNPAAQISQPLAPLVDEFAQRLFRELDYDQEGRNAEQFQQLYGDVPRVGGRGQRLRLHV